MTYDLRDRPPVVSDLDRVWAVEQKPADWDTRAPLLPWAQHVSEQAERFEEYFQGERRFATEWSGLWRRVWWPKADPAVRHPKLAPHVPHPFIVSSHPAWSSVLAVLSPLERRTAERFGTMTFRPNDPRVAGLGEVFTVIHEHPRRTA